MKKFESYDDAKADATANGYRELETDESYIDLPTREQWKIADIHPCGEGWWTWCYYDNIRD